VIIKKLVLLSILGLLAACGQSPMMTSPYYSQQGQDPYGNAYATAGDPNQPGSAYGAVDPNAGYGFASTGTDPNAYGASQNYDPNAYADPNAYNSNSALPPDVAAGNAAYAVPPATNPAQAPIKAAQPNPEPTPVPIPAQLKDSTAELKVLTYNVWGLPSLLGTDRKARFERLGQTLNDYDIVTLQETFSNDIEVLRKSTRFPYHLRWNNTGLRMGSGLYVLSKYPIIRNEFRQFGNCTVADCLARKGVLFTRIDHPTMGAIDVYTTHYQAEDKAVAQKVRIEEDNKVLQEFISQNNSPYPTIITGDFNSVPDFPEYNDLNRRLPNLLDAWRDAHPTEPGYTSDPSNLYKAGKDQGTRLDYIFVLKQNTYKTTIQEAKLTHNKPVEGYFLSDHFGVSAQIKFETLYSTELQNHPSSKS
jgi:endonuclease/exonuclease/phosphatase family metal-dependent hydrolase